MERKKEKVKRQRRALVQVEVENSRLGFNLTAIHCSPDSRNLRKGKIKVAFLNLNLNASTSPLDKLGASLGAAPQPAPVHLC